MHDDRDPALVSPWSGPLGSLRGRVRLLNLSLTVALALAAVVAVSRLQVLQGAVTQVLSRDYRSIEAAAGMLRAVDGVVVAAHDGRCARECPALRAGFERALAIGRASYTDPGESELVKNIERRGLAVFDAALANAPLERLDAEASSLRGDLDALVLLNRDAMFAADRENRLVANRLIFVTIGTFGLVAVALLALGWTLAGAVARPLTELAASLSGVKPRGPYPTLGPQPVAELERVAEEYRRMARRLEEFERLNVEAALDEKAKTEAVIESIEDAIIVLDPSGVVVHVNEMACSILDQDRADVLGRSFERLRKETPRYLRLRQAVRGLFKRAERGEEAIELVLFFRGSDHHYLLRQTPFRVHDGSDAGSVLSLQDVSDLRAQEARREQLLATLSHELRTPITSLRMAVELLRRDDRSMSPEQRDVIRAAEEDVERLQETAQRLLDLSRSRAASIALERLDLDLREVVERAMRPFGLQAREKGIALESELLVADGYGITGDPTKLAWALSNLLANAVRHTPEGGRVAVTVSAAAGTVSIAVSDTGPGIDPAHHERIFEPFFQSPDGGVMGSAGLGLAIVRDIVEAHGGRIRLESASGRGSRFTLEIPRA